VKNKLFSSQLSHLHLIRAKTSEHGSTILERSATSAKLHQRGEVSTPAQVYIPFSVTQLATGPVSAAPFPNAIIPNPILTRPHYRLLPFAKPHADDVYNTNNYASSVVNTVRRHTLTIASITG